METLRIIGDWMLWGFAVCTVIVGFGLLALMIYGAIQTERETLRVRELRRQEEEERIRRLIELQRLWEVRIKTGKVLSLSKDDRTHLVGKKPKTVDEIAVQQTFRRDVYDWCRSNLKGKYGFIPVSATGQDGSRIWFEDDNDAMYFKMRWY